MFWPLIHWTLGTHVLDSVWPKCWGSKPTVCSATWVQVVTYLEIIGIIFGQILVRVISTISIIGYFFTLLSMNRLELKVIGLDEDSEWFRML